MVIHADRLTMAIGSLVGPAEAELVAYAVLGAHQLRVWTV